MIHALAPQFLGWLPLAALPVLFHLFLRLRRQTRTFPSLMFFLAADPHLHARRNVREWAVLALRCLALAALVLALSRPQWRGTGGGGKVTAVLVIDNSASMATPDREGRTRLQRALAAAHAVADDPAIRRMGILATVSDPATVLPDGLTEDPTVWRSALDALRTTHAAGQPDAALAKAVAWLSREVSGLSEIHVFTDAQAGEWGGRRDPLALSPSVRVLVHRIGDAKDPAGRVALEGLERPKRIPVAGRAYPVEVRLRNFSPRAGDVTLCVVADASEPVRRTLQLPPHASLRVPVALRPEGGRDLQARVWLEGDAASPVATGWLAAPVSAGQPAWLAGRPEDAGLLAEALSPGGDAALSGVQATAVSLERLRDAATETPLLVALSGGLPPDPATALALKAYVERGGTLLVAPGAGDGRMALPEWCGVNAVPGSVPPGGVRLEARTPEAEAWEDLRAPDGTVTLSPLRAVRWQRLDAAPVPGPPDNPVRPLLTARLADGTEIGTALLERTFGAGRVVVSGLAWSPAWSDLPRRGAFLALVQTLALSGQERSPVLRAGDEAGWRAFLDAEGQASPQGQDGGARLLGVAGTALRIEAAGAGLPAPVAAGVYAVTQAGRTRTVCLMGDPSEAESDLLDRSALPWPALSANAVAFHRNAAETAAVARRGRKGRSLFALLAGLSFVAALGEGWLSQRPVPAPGKGVRHGS